MKKALILASSLFVLAAGPALAADPAKPADASKAAATAKLQKPAGITDEAWNKMSDAEKKTAVEKAAKGADKDAAKTAAAPKKEKKGGC